MEVVGGGGMGILDGNGMSKAISLGQWLKICLEMGALHKGRTVEDIKWTKTI